MCVRNCVSEVVWAEFCPFCVRWWKKTRHDCFTEDTNKAHKYCELRWVLMGRTTEICELLV